MPDDSPRLKLWGEETHVVVAVGEGRIEIGRRRTPEALSGGALQPIVPAERVRPAGEIEVIEALRAGDPLVIDMRTPDDWRQATIPGAINLFFREIGEGLDRLGCTGGPGAWDVSGARPVIAFCNGPACGQTPAGIRAMIAEGYPPERIWYYRGGLQDWIVLGLTTVGGTD